MPDIAERPGPLYQAIVDAMAEDIRRGRLAAGAKLPPHRDLAWRLKVTVGTVARAYAEAERVGLVTGQVGRGTFVSQRAAPASLADYMAVHPLDEAGVVDMTKNRPTADNIALVAETLRAVTERPDFAALLGYRLGDELPRHRAAAAAWLAEEGVPVPPERAIVTVGGQQAMVAVLASTTRPGEAILCEQLTYPGIKTAASLLDRRLIGLPTDKHGLIPEAYEAALASREARLLYIMPTVNNPTGVLMPAERRQAIVEIARRHDGLIVEDGVHAYLCEPPAPTPIAALAPERGYYLTALSKIVAPALRVGFVAVPEGQGARVMGAVSAMTTMLPQLMAEAAAMLIESGAVRRCAAAHRIEAAARHALVASLLGPEVAGPLPTFLCFLKLPAAWRASEFVTEAWRRGVAVSPAAAFVVGGRPVEAVRMNLSAPRDLAELERGLKVIAELVAAVPETCCLTV
ncbi:MAG: PLP-dependent aminotransferase family protein [Alphaproteobacteria bacterium]|nr:PLP-dependent aminotransferase family protein [Alphaproteobacteria bacterium]